MHEKVKVTDKFQFLGVILTNEEAESSKDIVKWVGLWNIVNPIQSVSSFPIGNPPFNSNSWLFTAFMTKTLHLWPHLRPHNLTKHPELKTSHCVRQIHRVQCWVMKIYEIVKHLSETTQKIKKNKKNISRYKKWIKKQHNSGSICFATSSNIFSISHPHNLFQCNKPFLIWPDVPKSLF